MNMFFLVSLGRYDDDDNDDDNDYYYYGFCNSDVVISDSVNFKNDYNNCHTR